ncbi:hypothetical protein A2590_00190 [Candidatus Adlerbacteria bacterium RIFOXYD1_FULL_48_8]|nr:MAG: hypothetical protein A2590_00190 [Candidatus Adlerbacteria bacterium RIFOXYD1_FULL_48_8]
MVVLAPVVASAQTGAANVGVSAEVRTTAASTSVKASAAATAAMDKKKDRAHQELQRRVDALASINARVQAMQQVTPSFKQSLANAIQTQTSAFQALDAKIQADTDEATLKADVQSITQSYRVYALVVPQIHIAAAADRAVSISTMMQTLGNKLAARIQAAADAGADVTALQTALNDLATKISNANTQAQASVSSTASLTPDTGDSAQMAANTAALKAARANLKTVEADLKAARADINVIVKGLAKIGPVGANATASSTTSVQ